MKKIFQTLQTNIDIVKIYIMYYRGNVILTIM